ncbi:TlpA disulfide reductase family protein [Rhodoferax sp. BAB1]|jgi:thiol-disulfide isomerase/thioredoxin|uniref:TlpA disulfide reductase family protein n=1 Tax=Rhodoferax sp. BAB1 TaxID=2741720 RepID=UPI001575E2CE|nr:TlpA disulfide reductase family protein [Rhodoferax sp. BAB1]QKO20561.1 TlpA family protein disulfide reductase [Rhodoferax sp. BAB1]
MTQNVTLGPLVLSVPLLLAIASYMLATFAGRRAGRESAVDIERQLLRMLVIALVAARAAFVLQFYDVYMKSPLDILNIRDGGWNALVGLGAAMAYAGEQLSRRAAIRKPLIIALGTGAAVWFAGALVLGAGSPSEVRMPSLSLVSVHGSTVALSSFEGKPTVVNLWATWCPPCQREMPMLQQAQAAHPEFHFIFLNQGESPQRVLEYLDASKLNLRNVLLDTRSEAGSLLGHRALPTTLFFDARGRLVDTRLGELSEASLAERLATLYPSTTPRL